MGKTRALTAQEKHELIYALAIARNANNRHARECGGEAAHVQDEQISANLTAEANRYTDWADLDEILQDLVSIGKIVILTEGEE